MNKATLYRTAQGWMMRHSGPWAAEVRALFGMDTLPTPFTAQAGAATVLAEIQRLNPEAFIKVTP